MKGIISLFSKDEHGTTSIEYGLIAGLASILIVGGLQLISPELSRLFIAAKDALVAAK